MTSEATPNGPGNAARRGRADLLRALLAGDDGVAAMADLLGYKAKVKPKLPPRPTENPAQPTPSTTPTAIQADEPTPAVDTWANPIPFWRLVHREYRHEEAARLGLVEPAPEPTAEVLGDDDLDPHPDAPSPQPRSITPWPQLWRVLDDRLRTTHPRKEIDVPRLVDRWARQLDVEQIPRLAGLVHCPTRVLVDLGRRLLPFRHDQFEILAQLERRLGPGKVRAVGWRGELDLGTLLEDEQVLALTDLGAYGEPADRRAWSDLGTRLARTGVPAHALLPVPTDRWPVDLGPWRAIDWSRPSTARVQAAPSGTPGTDPVEQTLRLAALAARLEAGLVRDLARLVPGATLATEAAVWAHPAVARKTPRGLVLEAESCRRWQKEVGELSDHQLRGAVVAFERWHRQSLPEVWAEEVGRLLSLGVPEGWVGAEAVEEAAEIVAKLGRTVVLGPGEGGEHAAGAEAFVKRLEPRTTRWLHPRFGLPLARALAAIRERDDESTESEPTAGTVPDLLPTGDDAIRHWTVRQAAGGLMVFPGLAGDSRGGNHPVGSWLATLEARDTKMWVGDGVAPDLEVDLETQAEPIPWSIDRGVLHLTTDVETVTLEPWTQPTWASAAGRDGHGLWAAFEYEGVEQRMRWIPPGRFLMGSPEDEEGRYDNEGPQHEVVLTRGYWLGEVPCIQALWEAVMGDNPSRFQAPKRPLESVSWDDVQRFLDRINFRVRDLELCLPTEAEWEHAFLPMSLLEAEDLDEIAWFAENSGGTPGRSLGSSQEVRLRRTSPRGLNDGLGNVWEWCWDRVHTYPAQPRQDPEGPLEERGRVLRGGSWASQWRQVRAKFRIGYGPNNRGKTVGFRLARPLQRLQRVDGESPAIRRARSWVDRLQWATDGGLDDYGRWAAIEVKGVVHRLRWIYPGRFLMGSPESEEGRYDREGPQHQVTLTEGFWLGETPCTQNLWQAVMGENPSRFQSPDRPVEWVSWHECHEFFEKLHNLVPGFLGQLPTEAQWEYACRAGTTTPTWRGGIGLRGVNNAPALDPIAWYGGNSGVGFDLDGGHDTSDWPEKQYPHTRAGTRRVALKPSNPWGLYDMLGNVWEWCRDGWDRATPYPGGDDRTDPMVEEGSLRVCRGGSWGSLARNVRAAYRFGFVPGYRYVSVGFRLSRGPEPRRAEPQEAEPQEKAEPKGNQARFEEGPADRGTRE